MLRWVAVVAVIMCAVAFADEEGKRVALIVGNDSYSVRPLQNAVNDARAMDKALQSAGFRTILRENVTKVSMEQAAIEFLQAIGPSDTALFFYAGHAVQVENENLLIPVDFAAARSVVEAKFRSFSLAMMFDYLKKSRAKRTIVVLDACRSNPVAESQSLQAGLAIPLNAGKETYIAFSTSPNSIAADNPDGKNSWFTEALADFITKPELSIDEVFNGVRRRVESATGGAQTPWSQTSLTGRFYFHPPKTDEAVNDVSMADKWLQDAWRDEQRGNWQEAIDGLNRILKQTAQKLTSTQERAKARLPYLTARKQAADLFEAGKYAEAAAKFEEALKLDAFAMDAAFEAADSYLLADRLQEAVPVLHQIRERGTSVASKRADAILKELAPVENQAGEELKRGVPQPPPLPTIFTSVRFGSPDMEAGQRALAEGPAVDLAKWTKAIQEQWAKMLEERRAAEANATTAAASTTTATTAENTQTASVDTPVDVEALHLQVQSLSGGRDLTPEEFGELVLQPGDRADIAVLVDGNAVTRKLPYKLKLPPGKYAVQTVERGATLNSKEVQVPAGATIFLSLK